MSKSIPMSTFIIEVPGRVKSQANARGHWTKRHQYAKQWRRTTFLLTVEAMRDRERNGYAPVRGDVPKHIIFNADVWGLMDDDNLESALKPIRDGLQDAQLIYGDDPSSGHRFSYSQQVNRKASARIVIWVETQP